MSRALNSSEMLWIEKLLTVNFKGKEILQKQLAKTGVTVNEEFSFISLKFNVDKSIEKFPFNVRVPVEMRAFQGESAPIVFLLHVIDGFANELEIFPADSSKIELGLISLEKIDYDINKDRRQEPCDSF